MKLHTIIILCSVFLASLNVNAFFNPLSWLCGDETINGAASIKDKRFTKLLTVNGAFDAEKIETEDLKINGAANISNSKIHGTLDVSGSLNIDSSSIEKQSTIHGSISGTSSTFKDKINAYGLVELDNSTSCDINIESAKEGKVILKGKTTINGTIRFKSNKGKVYISAETTITGGVEGGEIIRNENQKISKTGPIIANT